MSEQNPAGDEPRYASFLQLVLKGELNEALVELRAKHIPPEQVTDTFALDDHAIYRWTIHSSFRFHRRRQTRFFLASVMGAAAAGMLIGFVPLWLIALRWETFAFYCGLVVALIFLLLFVRQHWLALTGPAPIRYLVRENLLFSATYSASALFFVISAPEPTVRAGFGGSTDSLNQWMLFVLDHVVDVVLLGFPDELGVRQSNIRPQLWYSTLANQVLKLLIAVGVIDFVALLYRLAFRSQEFYCTVFETAARCHPLANYPGQLRRVGKLDTSSPPEVVGVDDFRRAMHERIRHFVYADKYRNKSLKRGGGTTEGAVRWLERHQPSESLERFRPGRCAAWLEVYKSFDEMPQNEGAARSSGDA